MTGIFAISSVEVQNPGSGYRVGDTIIIPRQNMLSAGMGLPPSSDYDYVTTILAIDDLLPLTQPFQLNFNPSPISSSTIPSTQRPPTVPASQQLLIGGPQLALHHMYNTTVSSSTFQTNANVLQSDPGSAADYVGPQSRLWSTSGSDPANSENYMVWNPDGSDCESYQNTNTPFLIQRGDVIRVEGIKNNINTANVSQSTAFIENFTVEEIEDYFYTSSFAGSAQNRNGLSQVISSINNAEVIDVGCTAAGASTNTSIFRAVIGTTPGVSSTNGNQTGTTIAIKNEFNASPSCPGWSGNGSPASAANAGYIQLGLVDIADGGNGVGVSGANWEAGDIITISRTALDDTSLWDDTTAPVASVLIQLVVLNSNIVGVNFNNDFTFGVDINATTNNNPTGSVLGYKDYKKGEVGFTAPTFIRVSPDPQATLNGLENGAITKFTVRRQVENETSVYLDGITPPSGSLGVKTPSGQGFLIPRDLSVTQKSNALNIINQLKQKNAFDKPIEPGVTRS